MPRAVFCEICGQMFFPASLKIHQKSCKERQSKTIMECPHCGIEMPQAELDEHLKKCKKALAAREQAGSLSIGADAGNSVTSRLPDGRVRCQFCGRGFAANRVQQHSAICGKLKQARPRGPNGTATQVPEKVYDASTADFARRDSVEQSKPCAFGTPKPAASRATQPGSAKKSPEATQPGSAKKSPEESMWEVACAPSVGHSPCSEAKSARPRSTRATVDGSSPEAGAGDSDPDGWRAKHREFIDAIRTARRAKTSSPAEEAAAQVVRAPSAPESPLVAGRAQEAAAEVLDVPTPPAVKNFLQQEKSPAPLKQKPSLKAPRQKGSVAKAAPGQDRRRLQAERQQPVQRPQRPQPAAVAAATELDWEVMSAGAEVLSPKSVAAGQSLSPVLRRASAPSSSTPTGSSHAGFPPSPCSNDPFSPGREEEDRESVCMTSDWAPGERVQVHGLLNARDLNGQMAVLLDYDLDASCWLVRLENGVVKAMRSEHMSSMRVPSKPPSVADTPEPAQSTRPCEGAPGASRSPSPSSRPAATAMRGPSPQKRQSKNIRPSASVGPRRLKASQTAELSLEPASAANSRASGARPPKAPRSSSAEPRRAPCDSPRPRRSEYANEVGSGRLADGVRGAGTGKLSSASPEDEVGLVKEQPAGISRSMRVRKTQEAPRACSKAASVPYISSVPEDGCPSQLVPPLEFAQTPKEKSPYRGLAVSRNAAKAVAALAGLPEGGGAEPFGESSPRQGRRCPSESPRVTGSAPEAMDSPVPPLDSPLASKGLHLSENTDGIDERQPASEPPLSGRAETASTAAGARTSGSFETGSSTPLSARNLVPATIHLAPPGTTWATPVPVPSGSGGALAATSGGSGFAPAAASTAPAALQMQPQMAFPQHSRATLPTAWVGAPNCRQPASAAAPAGGRAPAAASGSLEAMVNARASTRQLHTPAMTPSPPAVGHPQGQPVHGVMAPHPPASLCLFGSAQLPTAHQLQQAAACARSTQVPQPYPLSSPVMRTQPRRAA